MRSPGALQLFLGQVAEDVVPRTGDLAELRAIHRYVYDGFDPDAGQLRPAPLGEGPAFSAKSRFVRRLETVAAAARKIPWHELAGKGDEFVRHVAHTYLELHREQPFSHNTDHVARLFVDRLTAHAPFVLNWSVVDSDTLDAALTHAHDTNPDALIGVFAAMTANRPHPPAATEQPGTRGKLIEDLAAVALASGSAPGVGRRAPQQSQAPPGLHAEAGQDAGVDL